MGERSKTENKKNQKVVENPPEARRLREIFAELPSNDLNYLKTFYAKELYTKSEYLKKRAKEQLKLVEEAEKLVLNIKTREAKPSIAAPVSKVDNRLAKIVADTRTPKTESQATTAEDSGGGVTERLQGILREVRAIKTTENVPVTTVETIAGKLEAIVADTRKGRNETPVATAENSELEKKLENILKEAQTKNGKAPTVALVENISAQLEAIVADALNPKTESSAAMKDLGLDTRLAGIVNEIRSRKNEAPAVVVRELASKVEAVLTEVRGRRIEVPAVVMEDSGVEMKLESILREAQAKPGKTLTVVMVENISAELEAIVTEARSKKAESPAMVMDLGIDTRLAGIVEEIRNRKSGESPAAIASSVAIELRAILTEVRSRKAETRTTAEDSGGGVTEILQGILREVRAVKTTENVPVTTVETIAGKLEAIVADTRTQKTESWTLVTDLGIDTRLSKIVQEIQSKKSGESPATIANSAAIELQAILAEIRSRKMESPAVTREDSGLEIRLLDILAEAQAKTGKAPTIALVEDISEKLEAIVAEARSSRTESPDTLEDSGLTQRLEGILLEVRAIRPTENVPAETLGNIATQLETIIAEARRPKAQSSTVAEDSGVTERLEGILREVRAVKTTENVPAETVGNIATQLEAIVAEARSPKTESSATLEDSGMEMNEAEIDDEEDMPTRVTSPDMTIPSIAETNTNSQPKTEKAQQPQAIIEERQDETLVASLSPQELVIAEKELVASVPLLKIKSKKEKRRALGGFLRNQVVGLVSGDRISSQMKKIAGRLRTGVLIGVGILTTLVASTAGNESQASYKLANNPDVKVSKINKDLLESAAKNSIVNVSNENIDFLTYTQLPQNAQKIYLYASKFNSTYVIIDKPSATLFVIGKDKKLIASFPVLLGKTIGDEPNNVDEKAETLDATKLATTPAGVYTVGGHKGTSEEDYKEYEGRVFDIYDSEGKLTALGLHETYPGEYAQRIKALNSPRIDDNRMSWGCINVTKENFDKWLVGQIAENTKLFITPDDPSVSLNPQTGKLETPQTSQSQTTEQARLERLSRLLKNNV